MSIFIHAIQGGNRFSFLITLFSKNKTVDVCNSRRQVNSTMNYNYKTSLKELRSSLKYRSKEYLLENSLHGVPYFMDSTRPKWERITWFLLTAASVAMTAIVIVVIWNKFQTEPTITGLDIITEHINIEFPQIFLCFDWPLLNYSRLDKNEIPIYEQLYNWSWKKNIDVELFDTAYENKNNFREVFESMKPDCNNLIDNCAFRGMEKPCSKLFINVLASVGACCKFKALESLKITDLSWNLEFRTQNFSFPWRLYFIQNVDSSPKPGERPIAVIYFPVDVEFIVDVTYTTPDIRYLTLRQRECYFKQEGISFNECEVNCFIKKLLARCNCLPWFLSSTDKTECPISRYSCLNDVREDTHECDCWISCDHTSYSVKGIIKSNKDRNRLILRNWPTALYKKEVRFGYLDLLVSFGGIASLFLGYSLLTSVELGYYFSLRTYCGAVIQSSRKRYVIATHEIDKFPRKINVNPKYCQYTD